MNLKTIGILYTACGEVILLDHEDLDKVSCFTWFLSPSGHLRRNRKKGDPRPIPLSHFLLKPPPGMVIDHINRDPLDNRKSNLRIATKSQNGANAKLSKRNKTGFKGVTFDPRIGKFRATIVLNRKQKWLGYFDSAKEASKAYEVGAKSLFGNFAHSP